MDKKILYISGSMPPLRCGIGFYTNTFLSNIPTGFDLLTTSGLNSHKSAEHNLYMDDWKMLRLPKMLRFCRRGNYKIIHIQYPAKGYGRQLGINLLPYLVRIFTSAKLVVTLHEYHGSGFMGKSRDFITVLPAHRIIVSNAYDFEALPRILRRKGSVIPIGSNIPVAKPNPKTFHAIMQRAGFSEK